MVVYVIASALIIMYLVKHSIDCEKSLASFKARCDAGEAFRDWRLRNPGVYIGLSEEGRSLVADLLESYDWFMRLHPFFKEDGHREYLVSLFYDLPPKHPDHRCHPEQGVQTNALFLSHAPESTNKKTAIWEWGREVVYLE